MTSYTKTAIKGVTVFFIMSMFAGFIGYLVRLVFARELTKADYGLFYAVFALFGMLSLFRDMGLSQALIKYVAEFNIKKQYSLIKGTIILTFLFQFITSVLILVVMLLFSNQIALYFFHTQDASLIIIMLAIMFVLMPVERIFAFTFAGLKRFDFNSIVEAARMGLVLVFSLVAFIYTKSVVVPCLAYIFAHIFENFIFFPLFLKTFPHYFKVKAVLTKDLVKKLTHFGMPVMVGLVGSMIVTYTDTLAITYFRTLEEVALYNIAMPTSKLLLYFTTAVSLVVLPMSSELWAMKSKDKLRLGVSLLYKYSFVFIIPMGMVMFTFPEIIIKVFFGAKYVAASFVLQILAIASIIYTVCYINSNVLSGIGRPKENTKIILAASVFNLIGNIILVPMIGMIGAAIATLLSYCIMLVFTGIKIKHIVEVHIPWLNWLKNFFAAAIFVVIMYYLKNAITIFGDFTEMIIVGAIGCAVYGLLLVILRVIDLKEIHGITRYALKK